VLTTNRRWRALFPTYASSAEEAVGDHVGVRAVDIAVRQRGALRDTDHRPWPLRPGRWLVAQTWESSLFAHWRVEATAVQALLPDGLEVETYDGSAWLGTHAFRVESVRIHGTLPVPWISSFTQLNVRTYVRAGSKPGLWFFSLDTPSGLAAETARLVYRLPWHTCRLDIHERSGRLEISAARAAGRAFTAQVSARGTPAAAEPGSLEHFLFERYCLYAKEGGLQRAELHHRPWLVQPALGAVDLNTMPPPELELGPEPPLLHLAATQDTLAWPLEDV
jgi:uncharacterized protein YqjF (DUF2071 family)